MYACMYLKRWREQDNLWEAESKLPSTDALPKCPQQLGPWGEWQEPNHWNSHCISRTWSQEPGLGINWGTQMRHIGISTGSVSAGPKTTCNGVSISSFLEPASFREILSTLFFHPTSSGSPSLSMPCEIPLSRASGLSSLGLDADIVVRRLEMLDLRYMISSSIWGLDCWGTLCLSLCRHKKFN